jgi:putative NADPH-quinone reductase
MVARARGTLVDMPQTRRATAPTQSISYGHVAHRGLLRFLPGGARAHTLSKRILILQGHPDLAQPHLLHALADAYADAARAAGHEVRTVRIAELQFPLLASQQEWEHGELPASLRDAQQSIGWAEHIVLFFPLWLGDMPALVKAFLEQVARPGFAFKYKEGGNPFTSKGLTGRSARVVVTMGMPALVYRWYFRAHSVKSLERNVLGFVGIAPVRETLIGMAGQMKPEDADKWKRKLARLGERGE